MKPVIGLIVPPREPFLPPDAERLYGARYEFAVEGLGIAEMAVADFDAASERVAAAARALGERGAASIAMLGTSLSFFRGAAFNQQLEAGMREASGRPAVTATSAVIAELTGAKRLAVGAAYDGDMNERLRLYLEAAGFEVPAVAGMNIRKVSEAMAVRDTALTELAAAACARAPRADALLLSCGAFAVAHLLPELEARHGLRVVSSTPAALHAAVRALR